MMVESSILLDAEMQLITDLGLNLASFIPIIVSTMLALPQSVYFDEDLFKIVSSSSNKSNGYVDRAFAASHIQFLVYANLSAPSVVDFMIELVVLLVIEIASQVPLLVEDMKIIEECVPVDPHMIDGVPLLVCMDEYRP